MLLLARANGSHLLPKPAREYHVTFLYLGPGARTRRICTVSMMAHCPFEALYNSRRIAEQVAQMLNHKQHRRSWNLLHEPQIEKRVIQWPPSLPEGSATSPCATGA